MGYLDPAQRTHRNNLIVRLCHEPFKHRLDYLGGLAESQLLSVYSVEYDEQGRPKLVEPDGEKPLTVETIFRRRCYLNAITDKATVDRLWDEERERLAERAEAAKQRRKNRPRVRRKGAP